MVKRQNQEESKVNVSMYATEAQLQSWYDAGSWAHSSFGYTPGKYGEAYDNILTSTMESAIRCAQRK